MFGDFDGTKCHQNPQTSYKKIFPDEDGVNLTIPE
jgi:hypothetical protein